MKPCGSIRQIGLSYLPARLGIDSWAPNKVYKFGLWRNIWAGGGVEGGDGAVKRNKMNDQMLKYKHEKSGPVFLHHPSFDFDSSDFFGGFLGYYVAMRMLNMNTLG
jgi:hypothetical protein